MGRLEGVKAERQGSHQEPVDSRTRTSAMLWKERFEVPRPGAKRPLALKPPVGPIAGERRDLLSRAGGNGRSPGFEQFRPRPVQPLTFGRTGPEARQAEAAWAGSGPNPRRRGSETEVGTRWSRPLQACTGPRSPNYKHLGDTHKELRALAMSDPRDECCQSFFLVRDGDSSLLTRRVCCPTCRSRTRRAAGSFYLQPLALESVTYLREPMRVKLGLASQSGSRRSGDHRSSQVGCMAASSNPAQLLGFSQRFPNP